MLSSRECRLWLSSSSSTISTGIDDSRKEDLGLYGNQLNYMQTAWTVGYVIGEIPSNMMLTRVRPRYWIPTMELSFSWSLGLTAQCDWLVLCVWYDRRFGQSSPLDCVGVIRQRKSIYCGSLSVSISCVRTIFWLRLCKIWLFDSAWWRPCWEHFLPGYAVYHWVLVVS